MSTARALVIDDEPDILELLEITLGRMGIATDQAGDVQQAKALLAENNYQLCLTDMRLPDGNGLEVVHYIQHQCPQTPVAVITAHGCIDTAIESMKAGAFDFISKPVDLATLRKIVTTAIESSQLSAEEASDNPLIIGNAPAIESLNQSIRKLARSQAPVYISGESGSGKELVARSIHQFGPRAHKPFVAVNCGAIPRELMESEFFGHKKGSFTGAHQDKAGLFQQAEGGTLFFDEVADLPLDMQVKLLRAIQEKAIRPIGAQEEIRTDVRVLCATHKALEKEVDAGRFRQDLFYRLNVIQINVPPLRDRQDDIPMLARHLLERLASGINVPSPTLSTRALEVLAQYHFPGNVRELENILERAFTLCDSQEIDEADLHINTRQMTPLQPSEPASQSAEHWRNYASLDDYLADIERDILCKTLDQTQWNKTMAAKELGISFRSLRYRLQKLGLDQE
ncbi:sigma-54-dependent transcriptional regulator [Marinimicrobium alkaliphilum]|uniref:sigma-54-dependent transcriptional regulator n=1 Tax=Marinimicrobium alkaliphilum TaxID=2202654 RepID=UPI000DBAC124|nr:sigma-54 dependent transcriptional regulator [Marinimicrobium alkaliphilum]